ncbi:uncharacterized protein PAC_06165 [Phialocephala subalpina]|uniref:Uncharacterized protein n=1 Tax=Phialocephala subalpina TaxID=576137 RepID=A0A1L7WU22_9HELO|nr:uncharacterized protein PAC_06165 [Phialocephala subalpina]
MKNLIVLLGDDDSSASEAEADDGGLRVENAAADEGLLDSPETAIDSTTPAAPSNPDVWHDIDDFLETAQRLRRSAQKPSTFDCMCSHASSSRASSEPLHDHISAAGQCTVRARSKATMSHPARSRNQPPDHLPTDRSAGDEHELIRAETWSGPEASRLPTAGRQENRYGYISQWSHSFGGENESLAE